MDDHPAVKVGRDECWIPCLNNDWGGYCDHWTLCGRRALNSYVEGPIDLLPRFVNGSKDTLLLKSEYLNAEKLLKIGIDTHLVRVKRGEAGFFRSCNISKAKCMWIPRLGVWGNWKGNQLTRDGSPDWKLTTRV